MTAGTGSSATRQARGRFVVFEGGEASGKSTQAARLAGRLGAVLTREPGGTPLGEAVRHLLLEPSSEAVEPMAELLMMLAARAQHVASKIAPALDAGCTVVCERFSGSTLAYQGFGRLMPLVTVQRACELAAGGIEPDLVVLLDLEEELARRRRVGLPDRIESEDVAFHRRVREGFRTLAREDPAHWVVVDATGTPEEVERRVGEAVEKRLGQPVGSIVP